MNTHALNSSWPLTKIKLKQKFAQITDDDLINFEGRERELLDHLEKRTGHSRTEIATYLLDECDCDLVSDEPAAAKAIAAARPAPSLMRPAM